MSGKRSKLIRSKAKQMAPNEPYVIYKNTEHKRVVLVDNPDTGKKEPKVVIKVQRVLGECLKKLAKVIKRGRV